MSAKGSGGSGGTTVEWRRRCRRSRTRPEWAPRASPRRRAGDATDQGRHQEAARSGQHGRDDDGQHGRVHGWTIVGGGGSAAAFGESRLTRGAHRRDRHVEAAGHRTHLVDRLPQQQVEAADERASVGEWLPRPAGSATGRRRRRRPRARRPRRRRTSARLGLGRDRRDDHVGTHVREVGQQHRRAAAGARACRPTASRVSAARAGSRTATTASAQPSSASASRTEVAVAPPPSTTARSTRRGRRLAQRRDHARGRRC